MRSRVVSISVTRHLRQTDQGSDVGVVVDSLAALRLKDPGQTQAHLSQLAYCPTVGGHQPDAQLLSSHYPASDITVRLMPISPIENV